MDPRVVRLGLREMASRMCDCWVPPNFRSFGNTFGTVILLVVPVAFSAGRFWLSRSITGCSWLM
jgi:hypothetical protein